MLFKKSSAEAAHGAFKMRSSSSSSLKETREAPAIIEVETDPPSRSNTANQPHAMSVKTSLNIGKKMFDS